MTTKLTKMTGTDWRLDDHGPNSGNAIRYEVARGRGDDYELIASIELGEGKMAKAAGELIVRAVRSHEALVSAAEAVLRLAGDFDLNRDRLCADFRAALELAKGGGS